MIYINRQSILFAAFLVSASQSVIAASVTYSAENISTFREAEISRLSVRVASDGTGIIKNFSCFDCGFKILKVTAETRAYLKGAEIKTVDLVKRAKANVGTARFSLDSNTVYEIQFSR